MRVVPELIDCHTPNALLMQVRREAIGERDAARALEVWAQLGMQRVDTIGMLPRIWELRDNLTAYDATYVVVAEALDAELVTADQRLTRAPGLRCPTSLVHH